MAETPPPITPAVKGSSTELRHKAVGTSAGLARLGSALVFEGQEAPAKAPEPVVRPQPVASAPAARRPTLAELAARHREQHAPPTPPAQPLPQRRASPRVVESAPPPPPAYRPPEKIMVASMFLKKKK